MENGLNIGYFSVKEFSIVDGKVREVTFPSVVGTPDRAHFSESENGIVMVEPYAYLAGQEAIEQSRFVNRREDRAWINSPEWYKLFLAALSEVTPGSPEMSICAGLPVAFYQGDKQTVRDRILGAHTFLRQGRTRQTVTIKTAYVVPEPFGTLFDTLWTNDGRIADTSITTDAIGVIDVGSKTTNILSVKRLRETGRETNSANIGGWNVVSTVRDWLTQHCPKLELRDHEIQAAIIKRTVKYYGQPISLETIVNETTAHLAEQIVAQATQLWNGAGHIDQVLITGGGALLLGTQICQHFPTARIVANPIVANARGFFKYAISKR